MDIRAVAYCLFKSIREIPISIEGALHRNGETGPEGRQVDYNIYRLCLEAPKYSRLTPSGDFWRVSQQQLLAFASDAKRWSRSYMLRQEAALDYQPAGYVVVQLLYVPSTLGACRGDEIPAC